MDAIRKNDKKIIMICGVSDIGKTSICRELEEISFEDGKILLRYYGGWVKLKQKLIKEYYLKTGCILNIEYLEDLLEKPYISIFYDAYINAVKKILEECSNADFCLFDSHMFHPLTYIYSPFRMVYIPISTSLLIQSISPSLIVIITEKEEIVFKRRRHSSKPIALRTKNSFQINIEEKLELCGVTYMSLCMCIPMVIFNTQGMDVKQAAKGLYNIILEIERNFL